MSFSQSNGAEAAVHKKNEIPENVLEPTINVRGQPGNVHAEPNRSYAPGSIQTRCYPGYPQPGYANYSQAMTCGGPVIVQPGMPNPAESGQIQFAPRPEPVPGCPPGLEYLNQVDQLLIHQQIELFEVMTNWEMPNRYQIKNTLGQQIFFASEESEICERQCCQARRGFILHITDNLGEEIIRVRRNFKCWAGCNWCAFSDCCAMELAVESPPGTTVGYVKQRCSFLAPKFEIQDELQETLLNIEGPVCICQGPCCTWDQEFMVRSSDGEHIGKISKQWSGFIREFYTQADNFGVSFPIDMDVKMKATMLGAVFLIDFMFFEHKSNRR